MDKKLSTVIIDELNKDHRTYLSLQQLNVTFRIINMPYYQGCSVEANEQEILPYLKKYDINNYDGDINFFF